ncbi:hypothetical protein L218DRAFT_507087 [Marasmius fiardii PR-910]|nr:hypothetical protein L218DRAFT_507087 [Marasmius fiardii PR-910]
MRSEGSCDREDTKPMHLSLLSERAEGKTAGSYCDEKYNICGQHKPNWYLYRKVSTPWIQQGPIRSRTPRGNESFTRSWNKQMVGRVGCFLLVATYHTLDTVGQQQKTGKWVPFCRNMRLNTASSKSFRSGLRVATVDGHLNAIKALNSCRSSVTGALEWASTEYFPVGQGNPPLTRTLASLGSSATSG